MSFRSPKEKWTADAFFLNVQCKFGTNFSNRGGSETSVSAFRHDESKQLISQKLNYLSISLSETI